MRLAPYESANFTQEVTDAWNQLEPLYRQIHAYVRHKLAKRCVLASWLTENCIWSPYGFRLELHRTLKI